MSGIDQDSRLWACGAREKNRHTPIGNIGVVKGGLERFVLNQKALPGRQCGMRFFQHIGEPLLALPDICGPGVVRAVRKPHRDVSAVQSPCYLNAVFGMLQRAPANCWIWIGERPILVFLVLEQVRVDRARENSMTIRKPPDILRAAHSVRTVPKHMQRDGGTYTCEQVDLPSIAELLFGRGGSGRLDKLSKS